MSYTDRIDLQEALEKKSYDHGVICTYMFDPIFFEQYCLEKFNAFSNNGNISIIIDKNIYQKLIEASSTERPRQANIRYLLHPISAKGVFHPKIYFLVSKNKGRFIIGSANMTRPGITTNAELVACYDFEEHKKEEFKFLFKSIFQLIKSISMRWPSDGLTSNLNAIERDVEWLTDSEGSSNDSVIELIDNLDMPLWDKIVASVKPPVDTIFLVSRYFDSQPAILEKVYQSLKPKKIKIYTQNGVTTLTKMWLDHPLVKKGIVEIFLCRYLDGDYQQSLHGKAIAVKKANKYLLFFGSANFTLPALFKSVDSGNVEAGLVLTGIPQKDIDPEKLFNPCKEAVQLTREDQLQTSLDHEFNFREAQHEILLIEASLLGNRLDIYAQVAKDISYDKIIAQLTFLENSSRTINLTKGDKDKFYVILEEEVIHIINKESSIIQIEAFKDGKKIADSNSIFITNLLDIKTGQNIRRQRYIKEAQQGVDQFYQVLNELGSFEDHEALKIFLEYCDIPVLDAMLPLLNRSIKPIADASRGMRSLGEKNLIYFVELHELVIYFIERHLKKLKRHIGFGGLGGIFNFLHIFLAIGAVLYNQIERAIQGLEAKADPLTIDEWFNYRSQFDLYFSRVKQLTYCFTKEYVTRIVKDYKLKDIQERLLPSEQAVIDFYDKILKTKGRIDLLRENKLRIKSSDGPALFVPPYFKSNIFASENWSMFEKEIKDELLNLQKLMHL